MANPNTALPIKVLIIRFSSIGDVIQCLHAADAIRAHWSNAQIQWLVREDVRDALTLSSSIDRIWTFPRRASFGALLGLTSELRAQGFTHVYDAHQSLRSFVVRLGLRLGSRSQVLVRSKQRLARLLFFQFGINRYKRWPFVGALSFVEPLSKWGIPVFTRASRAASNRGPVALIPGSAWPKKNWPIHHWIELARTWKSPPRFEILGGTSEEESASQILAALPKTTAESFAGKESLRLTLERLARASLVISGDTGLMHAADYLGIPTVALIGPTAFGYPVRSSSRVAEISLPCKPCTKDGSGPCQNAVYQRCLVELTPQRVIELTDASKPGL